MPTSAEMTAVSITVPLRQMGRPELAQLPDRRLWFAAWTRSRHEKAASRMLEGLGVDHYLPLRSETRQWSDRRQQTQVPLFSGYLFVRMNLCQDSRLQVLKTPGIVGLVGNGNGPAPIPDEQIDAIRTVLGNDAECAVQPLLRAGDTVRVIRGPFAGVEGLLLRTASDFRLVISIELIQRSLSVSISRKDVEPVGRNISIDLTARKQVSQATSIPVLRSTL